MNATETVTAEEWADYCSDFRTVASEQVTPDKNLMLLRLPNRAVLGIVRYYPDGSKKYMVRKGAYEQYPQYLLSFKQTSNDRRKQL